MLRLHYPNMQATLAWLDQIVESPQMCALMEGVRAGNRVVCEGARASSGTLLTGGLAAKLRRPVLLVVAHLDAADDAIDDLDWFGDSARWRCCRASRM